VGRSYRAKNKTIRLQHNWLLRIAAVLVIGIGLFFASVPMQTTTELTQNKMQKTFLLPDDSEVTLNSASQIEYKKWNWTDHRELQLEGEAFFKVTKGQTFDVLTRLGKVTVVGTQFNVKARGDRFEVICFEGKFV
jgi:ferric-dicitrate binding protein FerR (iron transport regulator)